MSVTIITTISFASNLFLAFHRLLFHIHNHSTIYYACNFILLKNLKMIVKRSKRRSLKALVLITKVRNWISNCNYPVIFLNLPNTKHWRPPVTAALEDMALNNMSNTRDFDEIRGVWVADDSLSTPVFDISFQSKLKIRSKLSKIVNIYAD